MKQDISVGPFTLVVSDCGQYHVAPGGVWIALQERAEMAAELYADIMRGDRDA